MLYVSPYVIYGELDHEPRRKEKVSVKCPKCGLIRITVLRSHLQTIKKNNGFYLCHKCSIDPEQCSKNAKKLWSNQEKAELMRTHLKSDKMKEIIKEKNNKLFSDKEWYENWKSKQNPEKISESSKKIWQSNEYRNKVSKSFSDRCKKQWQDESYRTKLMSHLNSPERREKMDKFRHSDEFKKRMKEVWANPEYREKMAKVRLDNLEKMNNKPSSQQYILYSILDDLKVKHHIERKMGPYKVDCRIDVQDNISNGLIIEVNGDWWHSLPKRIAQDKSRSTYLMDYFPEYDLKYLWEHEFNNKGRVVDLLKLWLKLSVQEKVDFNFSDVKFRIIDFKMAELFISKYHYAGRIGRSGLNVGYFLGDILIAVCVFAYAVRKETTTKQGFKYKEVFELTRFAIHPSYQKKNLASFCLGKAINFVRRDRSEIKCLVSFADSTYGHSGVIYKAANWILDGEVVPDYWYVDENNYVCHKKTLWNKSSQMKLTESEYCKRFGYRQVWGDKKFRFIYRI